MKNFLDLLATELQLTVSVNNNISTAGLHDQLSFSASDTVTIDGIEILPKYSYHAHDNVLHITEPFYCWLHRVSGQGWLLTPN
jgi:hypothetical protein